MLDVGEKAPEFTLPNEKGEPVRLSDFRGKNVILFFYPKDMSPGCTREACAFRDAYSEFLKYDAVVIGINMDPPEKHGIFKERHNLPFILLSDLKGKVMKAYGVDKKFGLLIDRVTFIIDRNGVIRYVFKSQFRPKTHVKKALEALKRIEDDDDFHKDG